MNSDKKQEFDVGKFSTLVEDKNSILEIQSYLFDIQGFGKSCAETCFEEFLSRFTTRLKSRGIFTPPSVFQGMTESKGIPARILHPNQSWVSGRIRVKVSIEFLSDSPEQLESDKLVEPSALDDLRVDT